jgi:EmrB/QacA subfamily drug resistance transporter
VLVFINSSALVIALPDVTRDLGASTIQSTWFLLSYMLTTTTLILVFGRVADLLGRRTLYISGIVVFLVASVACGLAPDPVVLIIARLVQGVGAASIVTNTTALLTDAFPARTLSLGLGLNATVAAVGQTLGPLVGGIVTDLVGWRWIFLGGVPLGVLGLVWSLRHIPRRSTAHPGERLDAVGSVLSIAAIGALVMTVSLGGSDGWTSPAVLAAAAVAVLAGATFLWSQRIVRHPLVDLGIFDDRGTITLYASAFLCAVSSYAIVLLASLYFQAVQGASALEAALGVLPSPVGTMVAASAAGLLSRRIPQHWLSTGGLALIAAGAGLFAITLQSAAGYPIVALALLSVGTGIGLYMTPSTSALMARVPERRRGIANAIRAALQNAGYLLSTTLALVVATGGLTAAQQLAAHDGSLVHMPEHDVQAFVTGVRTAVLVFTGIALAGALVSAFGPRGALQRRRPDLTGTSSRESTSIMPDASGSTAPRTDTDPAPSGPDHSARPAGGPATGADSADYEAAGLAGHLVAGVRSALVVVDPVRAYVDPDCELYAGVEQPVQAMRDLVAIARRNGVHVVITTMSISEDGSDAGVFFRKVPALRAYLPGSPFGEFIVGLSPEAGDSCVRKQYPSAFFGTSLAANLVSRGVDTVVIAGLSTSGCVRATAVDTMQHGFVPIVVRDAVGDRLPSVHEANLFDIGAKIGEVWSTEQVAELWTSQSASLVVDSLPSVATDPASAVVSV